MLEDESDAKVIKTRCNQIKLKTSFCGIQSVIYLVALQS
eukprot:SAG11_NODE_13_length_26388_cov_67.360341_9_plen_39_part_00